MNILADTDNSFYLKRITNILDNINLNWLLTFDNRIEFYLVHGWAIPLLRWTQVKVTLKLEENTNVP